MGFFDEKRLRGTAHNGLIRGAGLHLHVWRSEAGLWFSNFTDTLPFPGSMGALPQQPCESFPFDFSLICAEKKPFHRPAGGCWCESGPSISCEGAAFKHLTGVCSPARI